MKRFLGVFLSAAMLLALVGCGGNKALSRSDFETRLASIASSDAAKREMSEISSLLLGAAEKDFSKAANWTAFETDTRSGYETNTRTYGIDGSVQVAFEDKTATRVIYRFEDLDPSDAVSLWAGLTVSADGQVLYSIGNGDEVVPATEDDIISEIAWGITLETEFSYYISWEYTNKEGDTCKAMFGYYYVPYGSNPIIISSMNYY